MLFGQKRPQTNFPPICFQSLWKLLQTTFLVSFLPIHKVLANYKFWPKSQGVSPCFLAKNAHKPIFLKFASNHSENDSKHHFSSPFNYTESFSKFEILTKIPRGKSMLIGQKRLKNQFSSNLLPITLKTTPNIISRLFLPIQKVLANYKFWPKSQGVSPCFLAKNAHKPIFLKFASNHSENDSKHHFSSPFNYTESFSKFEILTKIPRGKSMLIGQKRLKTNFPPICFQSLWKRLQTSFLVSFYLYRKF